MFDHPVILIIVVAAALLRWLSQKGQAEKPDMERPVVPNQPIPRGGEAQTEEERVRRFLEALGQPPGSAPPKVARRQVQPRIFPMLPPLTTAPPPLPPPVGQSIPAATMPRRIFTPAAVQEAGFEVRDIDAQTSPDSRAPDRRPAEQRGLIFQLTSALSLRSAIVLREIFGPPRSLQPLDPINGF